jgi:hypothetical protein
MLTGLAVGYALAHKDTPEIFQWILENARFVVPRFAYLLWTTVKSTVYAQCGVQRPKKELKVPNLSVYSAQINALDAKLSKWDPSKLEELLDSMRTVKSVAAAEPLADTEAKTEEDLAGTLADTLAGAVEATADVVEATADAMASVEGNTVTDVADVADVADDDEMPELLTAEEAAADSAAEPAVNEYRTATELAAAGALLTIKKAWSRQ